MAKHTSIRKFGYALRGEPAVYHRLLVRGKRVSAIAAISSDGLVDVELTTGSVNSDKFLDFVPGSLIPNVMPFDGCNSKSILILDNCSIHHVEAVTKVLHDAGILVIFLPPYSPDYNPIEEAFSFVEYYLKDYDEILQAVGDPFSIVRAAFDSIPISQCKGWIGHSGYD